MSRYGKGELVTVLDDEEFLSAIFRKWTFRIISLLSSGPPKRYNSLKRQIGGITPYSLSKELNRLEDLKVIQRVVTPDKPPSVSYSLTAKGWELKSIITEIEDWKTRWT